MNSLTTTIGLWGRGGLITRRCSPIPPTTQTLPEGKLYTHGTGRGQLVLVYQIIKTYLLGTWSSFGLSEPGSSLTVHIRCHQREMKCEAGGAAPAFGVRLRSSWTRQPLGPSRRRPRRSKSLRLRRTGHSRQALTGA